jgi:hypothetical protein
MQQHTPPADTLPPPREPIAIDPAAQAALLAMLQEILDESPPRRQPPEKEVVGEDREWEVNVELVHRAVERLRLRLNQEPA